MIQKLLLPSRKVAFWGLYFSVVASLLVYAVMVVRPTPLLTLADRPLLDLLRILQDFDPSILIRLVVAFVLLAGLYVFGWWAIRGLERAADTPEARRQLRTSWWVVGLGAVTAAVLLLYLYPFDAADIFDNIAHGRILSVYGANPFHAVASDFPDDPFLPYVAWKSSPSAYGPLWEAMAGFTARLAGNEIVANVVAFKLLPGLFVALSVALVAAITQRRAPERVLSSVWLLAWNPLVLYETFGHGHNDMAMAVWILAAAWAIDRRRYTLGILALLVGTLVKYIPVLLVPAAGLIALRELPTVRQRARFILVTLISGALLVLAVYAPFWEGVQVLTLDRRSGMFTTSLPSITMRLLEPGLGGDLARLWISRVALALTVVVAIYQAFRAQADSSWLSFPRAAFNVLVFYLLISVLWFQQWYMVWLVGLAALFPPGPSWALGLFLSMATLTKPFFFGPWVFFWHRPGTKLQEELILSLGVMALPWLAGLVAFWKEHIGARSAREPAAR
ncbi:MAG TPA: hypothetical protein VHO48_00010 [Anaerolineaceae bacterium]|nr:hypothetical protein [Anaerolineaceae bacterium]